MIRTGMRGIIELIRKHPKIRRILRCESPYFHHWSLPRRRDHTQHNHLLVTFNFQAVHRLSDAARTFDNDMPYAVISPRYGTCS